MTSLLILPASGLATRIGGLPKFLLPSTSGKPLLLEHVNSADGVDEIVIATRSVLAEYLTELVGDRATVLSADTETMSETVLTAVGTRPDAEQIAVGLPDTVTDPPVPYAALIAGLTENHVAVAAYPTRPDQQGRLGSVRIEDEACVEVRDKDPRTIGDACWSHHWGALAFRRSVLLEVASRHDPHVGFALEAAVERGYRARVIHIGKAYFDLGTVSELARFLTEPSHPNLS